jgi:hypothetical protein
MRERFDFVRRIEGLDDAGQQAAVKRIDQQVHSLSFGVDARCDVKQSKKSSPD